LHLIFFHYISPPPSVVSEPKLSIVELDNKDADLPRLALLNDAAFSASTRSVATSAGFGAGFGGSGGGGGGADGLDPPPIII
jgi:hypothetical protein